MNDPPALLGIYLNDHDAGAVAALELARRCRSSNPDSELGSVLHQFIAEGGGPRHVAADHAGTGHPPVAREGGRGMGAEKLGRLKPNGRLTGSSNLSRVEELEFLCLGIGSRRRPAPSTRA